MANTWSAHSRSLFAGVTDHQRTEPVSEETGGRVPARPPKPPPRPTADEVPRLSRGSFPRDVLASNDVGPHGEVVHQPFSTAKAMSVRDGRYEGANDRLAMELRFDAAVNHMLSADLFAFSMGSKQRFLASLRTAPGEPLPISEGAGTRIVVEAPGGVSATGTLLLARVPGMQATTILATMIISEPVNGLPTDSAMTVTLEWQGPEMRCLGLEVELERGVDPPPRITVSGTPMSIEDALERAGFAIREVGHTNLLPIPPPKGWSEKMLEALMYQAAQSTMDRPAFELRLLCLSKSNRAGLLGVMFDYGDPLPRQGAAIFADEIRAGATNINVEQKLIQTAVHELGHALNLAHRFEREIGRSDSLSFMNYDWRYGGGRRESEFWRRFDFRFDPDELAFLRHGPRPGLVPGGWDFRTMRYWTEGTSGYAPYWPEEALSGVKLQLLPPSVGRIFAFGQPVILGLALTNTGYEPIENADILLDQKAGLLQVMIHRLDRDRDAQRFQPLATRCYDISSGVAPALAPGETRHGNLNITFGVSGFTFAEPGAYEVTAALVLFDHLSQAERVTFSNTLRLRVAYPHSVSEENDALTLLDNETGQFLALGGSPRLNNTADVLIDLVERREADSTRGKARGTKAKRLADQQDPVTINLRRCLGFHAARETLSLEESASATGPGDSKRAFDMIAPLDNKLLSVFDPVTAQSTALFRDMLTEEIGAEDN